MLPQHQCNNINFSDIDDTALLNLNCHEQCACGTLVMLPFLLGVSHTSTHPCVLLTILPPLGSIFPMAKPPSHSLPLHHVAFRLAGTHYTYQGSICPFLTPLSR